ncbi:MAG: recombinase zinc beta ribbon domain-containing protein, partial [Acutalibacteraceae bacterium]
EQFDAVQVILSGHYHPPSNTGKRRNPLSGIVLCGNCGHPMQRLAIQSPGGPLLGCATPGCIVSSKLEYVEQAVLDSIQKELDRICSEADTGSKASAVDYAEMAKAIDGETRKAKQQLGRLHDLLEQGVYDVETFSERRQQLLERISTLEGERKTLVPPKQLDLEAMRRRIEEVLSAYPNSDSDAQNHLLKSIVEKVVYHKEKGAKPKGFSLEVFLRKVHL